MTRREKLRQAMLEDIKTVARQQMSENGTTAISLNAIARTLGVSQPALYRYYASRDDLVTTLIVDAYNDLANALVEAEQGMQGDAYYRRLLAVLLRYREWALEHQVDFQLIYGNPIPGYHAPFDVTAPAARRTFGVILTILGQAYAAGALRPNEAFSHAAGQLNLRLPPLENNQDPIPPVLVYIGVVGWYHIHGMIMLELFHHVQAIIPDIGAFYQHEVETMMRSMGFG